MTARASLTVRGSAMCGVGAALVVGAVVTGLSGLLRVGVLVLALPLLALVLAQLARPRVEVDRTLVPSRVTAGGTARVRLGVRATSWAAPRHYRAEDARAPALGRPARFVVERRGDGWTTVTYALAPARRGRYTVGPLRVAGLDPLGLASGAGAMVPRRGAAGADEASLLVVPAVQELGAPARGSARSGTEGRSSPVAATSGETSAGARDYRPGDHVRRVHWRATARVGRLMVREEEEPLTERSLVLLDTSAAAWRTPAAFEAAVSAVASVVAVLGGDGSPVVLVHRLGATGGSTEALMEALAVLEPVRAGAGPRDPGAFPHVGGEDRTSVVAVLGDVGEEALARLLPLASRRVRASALLLGAPTAGRALRRAGWDVAEVSSGESLATAWARLGDAAGAR